MTMTQDGRESSHRIQSSALTRRPGWGEPGPRRIRDTQKVAEKAPSLIGSPQEIDSLFLTPSLRPSRVSPSVTTTLWLLPTPVLSSSFHPPRSLRILLSSVSYLRALGLSLQFPGDGLLEDPRVPSHRPPSHPAELCPAVSMPTPAR